ncbi:hypothetical protein BGX38DRAFT_1141376 [Terfezia claveryi]|nr:hypothetical protein BGX38DRAFT_1141376 [Terfezia claveryi]
MAVAGEVIGKHVHMNAFKISVSRVLYYVHKVYEASSPSGTDYHTANISSWGSLYESLKIKLQQPSKMTVLPGDITVAGGPERPVAPAREMLDWGIFDIQLMRPPNTDSRHHDHMFIKISPKFATRPAIMLGLASLDADRGANVRVITSVENVHKHIFGAHIRSRDDTRLYRAGCTWLAMPDKHPHFQFGSFSTSDDPAWNAEKHVTHREIVFAHPYEAPPKVVLWFNTLDICCQRNEHIMTFATDVTRTGFTAHINSWGDTRLYGAGISWFAYPDGYPGICSGTVLPETGTYDVVEFEKKFENTPTAVLVGLNKLESDKRGRCSFNIITEAVSEFGMGIRVEGFGNTVLHSAGVAYIVIE